MTIDRRDFLILTGAGVLTACDSRGPKGAKRLLRYMERKNEVVERALLRHTSMDSPVAGARLAGRALPSYFISRTVPVWDESQQGKWTLEVSGMVDRPIKLTLDELQRLPRRTERVNHYCVEGWTAVEEWTGVRFRDLANLVGAQRAAKFVDFQSFDDDYHESWDIESAMHPQTVIEYGLDGHLLAPAHGAPARLFSPVKLGYKNTKYLTKIVFMPVANGGYWSSQGYEWYGGV
ncbi:MAG TPA: molybdopterin-dependent oxidoreductase [Gemmatimonadaceae bacterium]|nr:molybdopterin-dependent oxidoreductase [Gemmatimonadaceae bacterium]